MTINVYILPNAENVESIGVFPDSLHQITMDEEIMAVIKKHTDKGVLSYAHIIGVLEMIKLELYQDLTEKEDED